MKITIPPSRSSIIVDPLIALDMSKSDTLHFSIGDWWRISSWFSFLESWIQWICLPRCWVWSSTIVMPPTLWDTMAILAGNMSWFCFQLLLQPRRREMFYWIIFFDDSHCCISKFFGLALSFQLWCALFSHQGRVSAGQLCDLQSRLIHVSSRTAIYAWSTVVDDATALRWSQEARSTRAHSFVFHTVHIVWLD